MADTWGGSWGSSWAQTWSPGIIVPPAVAPSTTPAGVRKARFLRRKPYLRGYDPEPEEERNADVVLDATQKRKTIKAPAFTATIAETREAPISVGKVDIQIPGVKGPKRAAKKIADVEDEEEAILMSIL